MSRIYDALQRADLERQAAQGKDAPENPEPYFESGPEDLPPIEAGVSLENTVLHSWKPSLVSLPTLGDRGESIEQFRALRSQIYQFRDQNPLKTILVSSGMPAEGKTYVVANLAVSLARNRNNTVLLIDADLRRPALHAILGAPSAPGLTEYLAGTAEVTDILQRNENPRIVEGGVTRGIPDLAFIPAGAGGDNSSELVANHRIEELVAALSPHFDWILIDSPPVLPLADASIWSRMADGILLVTRRGVTEKKQLQRGLEAIERSKLLGALVNSSSNAAHSDYYQRYTTEGDRPK